VPPREPGGNCDIKDCRADRRDLFPGLGAGDGLSRATCLSQGTARSPSAVEIEMAAGGYQSDVIKRRCPNTASRTRVQASPSRRLQGLPDSKHSGRRAGQSSIPRRAISPIARPGLNAIEYIRSSAIPARSILISAPRPAGPHLRRGRRSQRLRELWLRRKSTRPPPCRHLCVGGGSDQAHQGRHQMRSTDKNPARRVRTATYYRQHSAVADEWIG